MKSLLAPLVAAAGFWLDDRPDGSAHGGALRQRQVGDFIARQRDISLRGVLANIGAAGSKAGGAAPGVVIASPSKQDPDYFYTWTRDAALTIKVLTEHFIAAGGGGGDGDGDLRATIRQYVAAQAKLQNVTNPSGGPQSGGLGEPKFHVNLTQFTDSWGRPQRDGPPLRATTLTVYANWLLAHGGASEARRAVWPVVARDLGYAVLYWNSTGFDLWEEVRGSSLFTMAATHRALVEGAGLARALGESCPGCDAAASQVLCFAQSFWSGDGGHMIANINTDGGASRSGKDVNSLLASIHVFDSAAACTDATLQPCSSRALANHKAVVDSFRAVYGVNRGVVAGEAVAVGRYAEDVYQGGHPWYLATLAAAEQLFDAIHQWRRVGSISVDAVSLGFFRDLVPSIAVGEYPEHSATFRTIVTAVSAYADGFVAVVKRYTPRDGGLAEQFHRDSGVPLSAVDLTWSYAAFISMAQRRSGSAAETPPSWGEPSFHDVPAICSPAPSPPRSPPPSCASAMTFSVRARTLYGETIYLTGSLGELANWSPADAIPLSAANYTPSDPLWTAQVQLPAATEFQYKYIKKTPAGDLIWLGDPNLSATSSAGCGSSGVLSDTWR